MVNKRKLNYFVVDCTINCDVFLGGSCNPTTWRADTAIPELEKQGFTFYNPVSFKFYNYKKLF